jgi:hypothetical protein
VPLGLSAPKEGAVIAVKESEHRRKKRKEDEPRTTETPEKERMAIHR